MPHKSQNWGFKVRCFVDSKSKYVSNFKVFCGKNPNMSNGTIDVQGRGIGEA